MRNIGRIYLKYLDFTSFSCFITKDEEIEKCINLVRNGLSMSEAARRTNVSRDTLKRIRRGVGIHAKYKKVLDNAVSSKR